MPLSNGEKPHLLTLPAEIKNKIWDYSLTNQVDFRHNEVGRCRLPRLNGADVWSPGNDNHVPNPHLGLLLSCKSIYYEVKDLKSSTALVFCNPSCASSLKWGAHCRKGLVYHDKTAARYAFVIRIDSRDRSQRFGDNMASHSMYTNPKLETLETGCRGIALKLDMLAAENMHQDLQLDMMRAEIKVISQGIELYGLTSPSTREMLQNEGL